MKTLKIFLIAIPVILLSCNSQSGQKKVEDNKDTTRNAMLVENANVEEDQGNDEDFVKEAASGGLMEVELGRYAQQNATHPRVKNFAAMMVNDHTKVNDELKSIAASKNITIPSMMEDKHQNKVNDLQKKEKGVEFDREYMKEMVDDHEKDVDRFMKMAENGEDSELKAFAAKTVQVLLVHQDSAKNIRDALK